MRIGILASGGNSPGMNNVVITLVKCAIANDIEPYLIEEGYKGLMEEKIKKANVRQLDDFNSRGNIMIYSSRYPQFANVETKKKAIKILKKHKIDVLIVIGGDGSYQGAAGLAKLGQKVMALPGTIDNDIASTDSTIGFYTCLHSIVTFIDALRDSFESHKGITFVEVMGRDHSELAIQAGIATDAEAIVTKDNIMSTKDFIDVANEVFKRKKTSCIFIITEKIYGKNGLPDLKQIAKQVETSLGRVCRVNAVGHMQRGGITSGIDRY
jgi:6-phosphofructokinase 1